MGLGLLGRGVGDAEYLAKAGADLIVTDEKPEQELRPSLLRLSRFPNIRYTLGKHSLDDFRDRDLILKGGGVRPSSPFIKEAISHGIPVRMSGDLFAELSGAKIVGVTGTRGKSTTTHLIKAIADAAGVPSVLGGNIVGVSNLALLDTTKPGDLAILELDSWQLHGFGEQRISPLISVFTTFYPDHMGSYKKNMRAYLEDKAHIFLHQKPGSSFIVGPQAEETIRTAYPDAWKRARIANPEAIASWNLTLLGAHNRENAACAFLAAQRLGIHESVARKAIEEFPGIPGRLEYIREVNGTAFYNDTTAIIEEATLAALEALKHRPTILIMGGEDKRLSIDKLAEALPLQTKRVILLAGTGSLRIREKFPHFPLYATLKEAVEDAAAHAVPGDAILFSPAFSSRGMFESVFDRGEQFNALVRSL